AVPTFLRRKFFRAARKYRLNHFGALLSLRLSEYEADIASDCAVADPIRFYIVFIRRLRSQKQKASRTCQSERRHEQTIRKPNDPLRHDGQPNYFTAARAVRVRARRSAGAPAGEQERACGAGRRGAAGGERWGW